MAKVLDESLVVISNPGVKMQFFLRQGFVCRGHEFSPFTSQSTPQNINQKTTVAMTQKQT
jgi:hypothetical protein